MRDIAVFMKLPTLPKLAFAVKEHLGFVVVGSFVCILAAISSGWVMWVMWVMWVRWVRWVKWVKWIKWVKWAKRGRWVKWVLWDKWDMWVKWVMWAKWDMRVKWSCGPSGSYGTCGSCGLCGHHPLHPPLHLPQQIMNYECTILTLNNYTNIFVINEYVKQHDKTLFTYIKKIYVTIK